MNKNHSLTTSSCHLGAATLALVLLALGAASPARAQLYWDTNGATAGSGATPTGTWTGTDWTTDSTGSTATTGYTAGDSVTFSAGSDAVNPYTVTLGTDQSASGVTFNTGTATIAGSTNTLSIGAGGITANTNATISAITALTGAQTWNVASGDKLTTSNYVEGNFVLTKTGTGTLAFTGANSTTGPTYYSSLIISQGTVLAGITGGTGSSANRLSYTSPVTVQSAGTLTAISNTQAVNTLTLTGGTVSAISDGSFALTSVTVNGGANGGYTSVISAPTFIRTTTATFNVGAGATNGIDLDDSGLMTNQLTGTGGANSFTKSGAGVMRVSNNNTYTGGTTVNAGTFVVANTVSGNNSATGTGTLALTATGTLAGTGQITPGAGSTITAASGTTISPGFQGVGTLTINGANTTTAVLTAASGAKFAFDLAAGGLHDQLTLTSGATNDISFGGNAINFTDLSNGGLTLGSYTLFSSDTAGSFAGLTEDGTGKITAGLTIGTGLGAYSGSNLQEIGDSLVLNLVPEPSPVSMMALGLIALLGVQFMVRRRQAVAARR